MLSKTAVAVERLYDSGVVSEEDTCELEYVFFETHRDIVNFRDYLKLNFKINSLKNI